MATIKRTALLLEDEPLISMDLEATLADAGFAVVPVMTCADALAWLDGHTPDVVVVDIMLRDGPSDAVVEKLIGSEIPSSCIPATIQTCMKTHLSRMGRGFQSLHKAPSWCASPAS